MKMEKVEVKIKSKTHYDIFIGNNVIVKLNEFIEENHSSEKIVIITDNTIKRLYDGYIKKINSDYIISLVPGEESKSRETKKLIEDELIGKKFSRDTVIIAFGGGVVGDVAGFVASTFNRGIQYVQVPTTLLAMVDSSIGGKTGVNTKHGKNLIGTIYQPDAVFADLEFLKNLPQDEFLNGLAETIKMAIALDAELFQFVEENYEKILAKEEEALVYAIRRSVGIKRDVVEKDEKEQGLRQVFNFGHTIGHAVEAYSGFSLKHGFCVAVGIAVESRIAVLNNDLSEKDEERIISLLKKLNFKIKIDGEFDTKKLIELMISDKKARKKKPRFVILKKVGRVKQQNNDFSFEVDEEIIKKAIDECKDD